MLKYQIKELNNKFYTTIGITILGIVLSIIFLVTKLIIVGLVLFLLSLLFELVSLFIYIIAFKNKMTTYNEDINAQKSKIKICQKKYLQVLNNIQAMTNQALESKGNMIQNINGLLFSGKYAEDEYQKSIELVQELANEYSKAQEDLNFLINDYNSVIVSFPTSILAKKFQFEKLEFVCDDTDTTLDFDNDN